MFDNAKLELPCPTCSHQTEKSIARIKMHDRLACEECGSLHNLVRDELIEGIAGLEQWRF